MNALRSAVVTLLIGTIGGFVFFALHSPLPWTLGPLAATAIYVVVSGAGAMSGTFRDIARPVVGLLAGSAFTPAVIASAHEWWSGLALLAFYAAIAMVCGFLFFRYLVRLDPVTSFCASAPAGLSEMTLLGGSMGGNMRSLVLIHSIRVVLIVFAVPTILQLFMGVTIVRVPTTGDRLPLEVLDWILLAGCGIVGFAVGKRFRIPNGVMLVPMLLSALVHGTGLTDAAPPAWLVICVQIIIGCAIGSRFAGLQFHELRKLVGAAIAWAVFVLAVALASAAFGAAYLGHSFPSLLLALAPAGSAEMAIVAYALNLEVAFVVTCQVFRAIFILTLGSVMLPMIHRRTTANQLPAVGDDSEKDEKE